MALYNTTTKAEFDEKVLKNDKLVLVDFWALWCPPCRMMAPILEATAKKMEDKIEIVKVDVEASADNGALAGEYGVRGIPNMQVFKGGKVVKELIGARPVDVLQDELTALL
jgi:thioredoxin 1